MGNKILSVVIGLLSAFVVVMIFDYISHLMYPVPEGVDMNNPEVIKDVMKNLPAPSFIIMVFGWMIASAVGAYVCSIISKERHYVLMMVFAVCFMITTVANLIMIPHPIWVWIGGLLVILPAAIIGFRWSGKPRE